jgi:hypothetical protein
VTSAAAIRALVSGYPRRLWSDKLLVMIQAYVDDSEGASANRPLVLAAYIHAAEEWIKFSDAWDAALHEEPRIEYFKMVEAQNLRDQFKGWSHKKRTRKLFRLAEVIAEFGPFSLDCWLNARRHKEVLKPHAPYGLSSPYYPLSFALACGVARVCHGHGANHPIDFIFDKQDNVSKHVLLFWDYTVSGQPPEWGGLINPSPIFRDDKDVLPLQAADFLAWHTRRELEGTYPKEYEGLLGLIRPACSYSLEITDEYLAKWGEGMQQIPGSKSVLSKSSWDAAIKQIVDAGFPSAEHRASLGRG